MSPANMRDMPPNGIAFCPVASFHLRFIQANIFWPVTENSSIIKHSIF